MLYEKKKFILKDGNEAIFLSAEESDAEELSKYMIQRAKETEFMYLNLMNVKVQKKWQNLSQK